MKRDFPRQAAAISSVFDLVQEFCEVEQVDARSRYVLELAGEELFLNAVKHNPSGADPLRIELLRSDGAATIVLTDFDTGPFDPTTLAPPDLEVPLAERRAGGLGIHLIRKLADDLSYEHEGQTSRTSVTKALG